MDNDDELLRALMRIAQQDPTTDPRWRQLSEEKPSDAERNALESSSTHSRSAREAFTPLDDDARARLTEGILSQLAELNGDAAPPSSLTRPIRDRESGIRVRGPHEWGGEVKRVLEGAQGAEPDSLSGTSVAPLQPDAAWARGAEVMERGAGAAPADKAGGAQDAAAGRTAPRAPDRAAPEGSGPRRHAAPARPARRAAELHSRTRTVTTLAGWTAAAVLLSLLALRPAPFAPGAAPLPAYKMKVGVGSAGAAEVLARDDANPEGLHLAPDARLALALTPGTPVRVPVAVKAFLVHDGEVQAWQAPIHLDDGGAVHVSGTREALFPRLPAGTWDVLFVIGQPELLPARPPSVAEALPRATSALSHGCYWVRQRLLLD